MTDPADPSAGPEANAAGSGEAPPIGPSDARAVSERTRRAVELERRRREADHSAARRRARSPLGIAARGLRWARNRQTGPLPRARRMAAVLAAAARGARRDPALLRRLPADLVSAALAPVRVRGASGSPPARPRRSWESERAGARARLAASGREPVALESIADLRIAAIADDPLAGWLRAGCDAAFVHPEDWRRALEKHPPHLLLVTDAWWGNGGSWQYRVAWHAHPDALFLPDLRALAAWCAGRAIPSVFLDTHGTGTNRFAEAAALLDLIVAPDEVTARRYLASPNRRGVGVAVAAAPAGPASAVGLLERIAPTCGIRVAGPGAAPLATLPVESVAA